MFAHDLGRGQEPSAAEQAVVLPLAYACSGCSAAAQMANALALRLDRSGLAEMSCIAGIGGDVPALLRPARSGRPLIVLDGCRLHCARRCLERHALRPTLHFDLSEAGVKKRQHADPDPGETEHVWTNVVLPRLGGLPGDADGLGMIQSDHAQSGCAAGRA